MGCLRRAGTRRCGHCRWGKHDPGTLAEAFQGEYDVDGSHTAYALQAKEALIEQEEDIDLETALAALELESDTDLEETDVQEIPLAYKKPRER